MVKNNITIFFSVSIDIYHYIHLPLMGKEMLSSLNKHNHRVSYLLIQDPMKSILFSTKFSLMILIQIYHEKWCVIKKKNLKQFNKYLKMSNQIKKKSNENTKFAYKNENIYII